MECEEFLIDYSDFLDRQFEEHSQVSYYGHLLGCSDCSEYDRVMRRGLEEVRHLEPPGTCPDFVPLVEQRVLGPDPGLPGRAERGRAALVAGLAALTLFMAGSLAVLNSGGTMELPPVVVEPGAAEERPSLWGPAPRFTPALNLLQVPERVDARLLRAPSERLSLFRAPLRTSGRTAAKVQDAAPE
jgi:hypothetical protein